MKDMAQLHPKLQLSAIKWIKECEKQNLNVKIGECLRTVAEQDALYAQGRTKPGAIVTNAPGKSYSSMHQWGVAFDFYLNMDVDGDGRMGDDAFNDSTGLFEKAGQIAKSLGLEWGGDWTSIVDKPHIQLPDWGSTAAELKKQYGTPEVFMKSWEAVVGWVHDGKGYWYRHEDGSYTKNDWEEIDGYWYWFDGAGYRVENNWYFYKDNWYYLGGDGRMYTGFHVINKDIYYFDANGAMGKSGQEVTLRTSDRGALLQV